MKKFIIEKVPLIFFISLLAGTISQWAVQTAGFNIKGLWLLVCLAVFTLSGFICFGLDCKDENDKKK
mgnify:CR=1 FL=1|jgi:hypothetical protein